MQEPREVVERVHRLVLDGDVEGQAELFAPDGVLEGDPYRLPYIQVFRVRDGAIVSFRDYFGPGAAQALAAAFQG